MANNRVMLIAVAKYILVAVFLFSSISKILYPGIFFNAIQFYGITQNWLKVSIFVITTILEFSIWMLLLIGSYYYKNSYLIGILLSLIITSVFLTIAIFSGSQHIQTQCGCLGKLSLIAGSYLHIIFSTMLFLLSGFLAFHQLMIRKQIEGLKIIITSTILLCFSVILTFTALAKLNSKHKFIDVIKKKYQGSQIEDLLPQPKEIIIKSKDGSLKNFDMDNGIIGYFNLNCQRCLEKLQFFDSVYRTNCRKNNYPVLALVSTFSSEHVKLFIKRYSFQVPIQYYPLSKMPDEEKNELLKSSFFIQLSNRAINDISFNLESLNSWIASWKNGKANTDNLSSALQDSESSANSNAREAIFSLHPVDTIGCKSCENEYEIFANLRDINTGPGDSLYILDSKFRDIRIFDRDGNYAKTILIPDEIMRPSSIAIRHDGKIYIAEQLEGKDAKIFLIDQSGKIINNFSLYFMPWLVRWKDGALFINSLPYYGNETKWLVHKYDPNGKLLAEFCHRLKNWAKICKYVGGTNGFLALSERAVFFAFGSTYDIRSFSMQGDSLNKFYRSTEYFGGILEKKAEGPNAPTIKFWTGFCLGMTTVSNNYLLYFSLNKKEEIVHADVWSLAGNFLDSFKLSRDIMPRPHVLLLTNNKNYIYMSIFYPYPHILKLELKRVLSENY